MNVMCAKRLAASRARIKAMPKPRVPIQSRPKPPVEAVHVCDVSCVCDLLDVACDYEEINERLIEEANADRLVEEARRVCIRISVSASTPHRRASKRFGGSCRECDI